jgi:serine/threonine protein kinase
MKDISSIVERMMSKNKNNYKDKNTINRNNFKFLYVIGKGGFGRVWKIKSKKTNNIYALKEMSKLKIIDKKSEKSINSEREFLSKLNHPFIVNMHYAFQDKENLYLVMDMLSGGDLRYHVSRYRKFSEEQTRFFISNMVYALKYIHENNVIHRDLKPENLVLDENGYLRITDFGIAKENKPDNSSETSGTPGYMAPEVMKAKNHSFPVDYFAIGVIGYEFMLGKRPFYGSRREIKEQMTSKDARIKPEDIPKGWSNDSVDFINQLIHRKSEKRLGSKEGAKELMRHPWLKYYPWEELIKKNLKAPFVPDKRDNFDKNYCDSIDKISQDTKGRYEDIYASSHFRTVFVSFYYNKNEDEKRKNEDINENIKGIINDLGLFQALEDVNVTKNKELELKLDIDFNKDIKVDEDFDLEHGGFKSKTNKITKYSNYEMNNNENQIQNKTAKNKTKKDDSGLSSINFNINKFNNNKNSNINIIKVNNKIITNKTYINKSKPKSNKRPLSHSNSTQEIISSNNINNIILKSQKNKANNFNGNIHNQIKQIIKSSKITAKYKNIPINQKEVGTSININNYYTNDFYSVNNNFFSHHLYSKFNNNTNKKTTRPRASSAIGAKNKNNNIYIMKSKKVNQNKNNNIYNVNTYKTGNINAYKKNKVNSGNQFNFKSSENEFVNKSQKWKK